jgi:hypothetical protein
MCDDFEHNPSIMVRAFMRNLLLILSLFAILVSPSLAAQTVCGQAPVTTWTVQFFERWEDAVAKMVANSAFRNTMALVPVRSATKNGYVVTYEQVINFTNDCPPRPIGSLEKDTPGWHRQLLDSPTLGEAFVASLPMGTPVGMTSLYAGYSAGESVPSRRRGATHSSVTFPQRGLVVLYFAP